MMRLSVWPAVVLSAVLSIPVALASKPKTPKIAVQVYGVDISYDPVTAAGSYTAYLILPDGSHALASCLQLMGGPLCKIEAFVAEKRVKIPCNLPAGSSIFRECYQSESYWAERKGNDITLSTINGKVTYHIYGSW